MDLCGGRQRVKAFVQHEASDPIVASVIHDGLGEIVRRRLFADRLTMPIHAQIWELAPGTSEGDHTHSSGDAAEGFEELYYVLAGVGTLTMDGERLALAPGDAVLVPTDVDHGLYADAGQTLRILLIFGKPAPRP
jgi:quercetin dioxygenase-like cupin family protein